MVGAFCPFFTSSTRKYFWGRGVSLLQVLVLKGPKYEDFFSGIEVAVAIGRDGV
jgi:hypothetical protein